MHQLHYSGSDARFPKRVVHIMPILLSLALHFFYKKYFALSLSEELKPKSLKKRRSTLI